MKHVNYNANGEVWVFANDNIQVSVILDTEQKLSLLLTLKNGNQILSYVVYAKCSTNID